MSNSNLVKIPIVDKNGKNTSVHKKAEERVVTNRVTNINVKQSAVAEQELLAEVNHDIEIVRDQLDQINEQRLQLNILAQPLNKEYEDLINMKMELEAGKITHESSLEDIQELNRLAFSYAGAHKNEVAWVKGLNPRFETDSYDTDHSVPIVTMRFDYDEKIDDQLIADIKTFTDKVADGREYVSFNIATPDSSGLTLQVDVDADTCVVSQYYSSGRRDEYSGADGIRKALEWVTKNAPWNYPPELKERLYPSDYSDEYPY